MTRQYIKFNDGCLLVLKMTQNDLDSINQHINAQIAYRSINPDKSDEDIDFLIHVYPLKVLKVMTTLSLQMQTLLRNCCIELSGEDLMGEPESNLLFGIELINNF